MFAYALASKPCSETTYVGYILFLRLTVTAVIKSEFMFKNLGIRQKIAVLRENIVNI